MNGQTDAVAAIVRRLRADVGDIEFGYRAQALFAHVLERIGGSVLEIRNQGHPDILANLAGRLTRFEIEIASKGNRHHVIKADDLAAIAPIKHGEVGYLAVLDMAEPLRWAVLEHSRVRCRLGRVPISTLHAVGDRELAKACNGAFAAIILENAERLAGLTFHLLCHRILRPQARSD